MAGPYTPETMYVTLEGSIVQTVTLVDDQPTTVVDAMYYDTEYWRNLFNAGELGRAIPADKPTDIIAGTVASGSGPPASGSFGTGSVVSGGYVITSIVASDNYSYTAQVVFPTNPDTYMAKDDRMQSPNPTAPRPLAKSRSKIVFSRRTAIGGDVLSPCWFWADEVIGYAPSRPTLLGYS